MISTLLSVAVLGLAAQAPSAKGELVVVVSSANEVKEMSLASVGEVFLTRRQFWANRKPVTLVLMGDDAKETETFCHEVVKRSPPELSRIYLQQRYRGQLIAKVVRVADAAEMAKTVAADPTAIGYLPAGPVPAGLVVVAKVPAK